MARNLLLKSSSIIQGKKFFNFFYIDFEDDREEKRAWKIWGKKNIADAFFISFLNWETIF